MNEVLLIVIISLIGPFFGALLGVLWHYSERQIYHMLSFAAGVMVFISVFGLLPQSLSKISINLVAVGFVFGLLFMYLLNEGIPHFHHHEHSKNVHRDSLKRTAFFIFLGITIHNLPEGIAIGVGSQASYHYSILVALAIALHDIPETICVAAPMCYTTGKRFKTFFWSVFSAVPTIVGFLVAYYFFSFFPAVVMGVIISATAAIMLYISLFEIIPSIMQSKVVKKEQFVHSFVLGSAFVYILQLFT